jgi:hypothetical protein
MRRFIPISLVLSVCGLGLTGVSTVSAATWTIQTTPNASGAEHSAIYDIACSPTSISNCVSVGKQTASGGKSSPYGQFWNGSTWTNSTFPTLEGTTAGELQSVDCIIEEFCFGAGSYTSSGVTAPLTGFWIFGSWSATKAPSPEGASEAAFKGASCEEFETACAAVGYSVKSGVKSALIEKVDAEANLVIQSVGKPEGATSSELHGIDCPTTTFCMAVGSYGKSAGEPQWAWSASWNGSTWTLRTVPNPEKSERSVLLDVSCSSASNCTGVGGYRIGGTQKTFVERWNGSSWSYQTSPNPVGSTNTVFQNVSCTSIGPCVAVGDWYNGKNWQPMAQAWNGSAWALDTTPNPVGATETVLEGVVCRTSCLSVGWFKDSGGKLKTLGESR